jgi:serine/threonine-protein kinase
MRSLVRPAAQPAAKNAAPITAAASRLPAIAGYTLVRRLASGRWSELFLACAASQSAQAAPDYVVKRARQTDADPALSRALLQREAQVAAAVTQPNLVSLLDADLQEDPPFLVLPFLPGQTLEQLRTGSSVSVPQSLWYVRQIAAALAALHAAGWIHGDVKPANVIVSPQGHATLIDLGLARQLDSAECRCDQWLAGDPAWMAPEAFQPSTYLTPAADLYSLGLVLFHLLLGAKRVIADPRVEAREAISDLRAIRPDVSRELAGLLSKLLAHEPLRRPSAAELVETLSRRESESLMQW